MARSSKVDPVEKFRFRVTILTLDFSLTGVAETASAIAAVSTGDIANVINRGNFGVLSRAGFSSVTLPKMNVGEMSYRENKDNLRFQKIPGLVKYDPITLSRGVTSNRDFHEWARLVNEELALLSTAQELTQGNFVPSQSNNFRKDVFIEVLDREGKTVKGWFLLNSWPTSYKPGNDLMANSEEKLVEELTLTYEMFLEVNQGNGLQAIATEIVKSAVIANLDTIKNKVLDFIK